MSELTLPTSLAASLPVLLLPVSVQVKYVRPTATTYELRVRFYPDQLGVSTHEDALTAEEAAAGRQYWTLAAPAALAAHATSPHDLGQWRLLVGRYGAPRALWIVRQTKPDNWASLPGTGPTWAADLADPTGQPRWTRAAQARALPHHFAVRLYSKRPDGAAIDGAVGQLFASPRPAYVAASVPQPTTEFLQLEESLAVDAKPITNPALAVGLAPPEGPNAPAPGTIGGIDEDNAWTVDFDKAEALGMAVRVALSAAQYKAGFERLVVVGVHDPADPALPADPAARTGQAVLEGLLTEHAFSGGLALVPQGTATNNTDTAAAGYSSDERRDADAAFALLTQDQSFDEPDWTQRADGQHLVTALGLDPAHLPPLAGAPAHDVAEAQALNRVLWPATYGYFLEEMLHPLLGPDARAWVRQYFENYVLARGPVPALRVGAQPYGVLPTTRFSAWEASSEDTSKLPFAQMLTHVLAQLDVTWTERLNPQAGLYPTDLGTGALAAGFHLPEAPGDNLLTTLGLDAASTEYYQRYAIGPALADALQGYAQTQHDPDPNADPNAVVSIWPEQGVRPGALSPTNNPLYQSFQALLDPTGVLGLPAASPVAFGQTFQSAFMKLADAFADEPGAQRREGVLLDDQPLSETRPVAGLPGTSTGPTDPGVNYLAWLATASFDDIRLENFHGIVVNSAQFVPPTALLYQLLRQAVLLQYWGAAKDQYQAATGQALPPEALLPERELFNILHDPTTTPDTPRWAWLYTAAGGQPLYQYLQQRAPMQAYLATVAGLATLPTARLERLLAEHLDLGSYRLDAWRVAAVTERLHQQRKTQPTGTHLGAFGWLENLHPADAATEGADHIFDDPDNLGYIHAPSLPHGTAAALLRQGYKSRQLTADPTSPAADRMAVDISSRRVRHAQALLEGLREGHALGALLGQSLERALQQHAAADTAGGVPYGQYVQALRTAFPLTDQYTLPAGQAAPANTSQEAGARQVIDGAALLRTAGRGYPYGLTTLPPAGTPFAAFMSAQVALLVDDLDALGDLAVGEGLFQAARGNVARAAAVLDSIAKGQFPLQPDFIHPPQQALTLTQRVLLHLPLDASLGAWASTAPGGTPRQLAAPRLNAWLTQFFPDPTAVTLAVGYQDAAGAWAATTPLTLQAAGLLPLDLLYVLEEQALQAGSAFDVLAGYAFAQQAAVTGLAKPTPDAVLAINYADDQASPGLPALRGLLPLLARLRQLLGSARPARPLDLQVPGHDGPNDQDPDAGVATPGLHTRLDGRQATLTTLAGQLAEAATTTPAGRRAAFYQAALFGLTEAVPALAPTADLALASAHVRQAALARTAAATAALQAADTPASRLDQASALFGSAFRPDVEFSLGGAAATAYATATAPGAGTHLLRQHSAQPLAMQEWLHGVAAVREPLHLLDKVLLIQSLLHPESAGALPLLPAQLSASVGQPDTPDAYWLGLPWPSTYAPPADALSLVQWLPATYDAAQAQAALWLDEWAETLPVGPAAATPDDLPPVAQHTTALTFHYDQPNSAAPQALLLVVSPRAQATGNWTSADLLGAVNETLDLAKKRTVEPDALAFTHLAAVLPAVVAPVAQQAVTLTLDLGRVNGTARFREDPLSV